MKQCRNCLQELQDHAEACDHCTTLVHPPPVEYFYTPPLRFLLLSFITFGTGFYSIYWFYKNWAVVKQAHGIRNLYPFWRAIFHVFFCWSLFRRIYRDAAKYGHKRQRSSHIMVPLYMGIYFALSLAAILAILGIFMTVRLVHLVFFLLTFLPLLLLAFTFKTIALLVVQRAIKFHNVHAIPGYSKKRKLTKAEIVLILLGLFTWLVGIITNFLEQS